MSVGTPTNEIVSLTSVRLQVERSKKVLVLPSTAFCGIPPSATLDCIGAFPAATFSTGTNVLVGI